MKSVAFKDVIKAVRGAVDYEEKDGYLCFFRFTKDEFANYSLHNIDGLMKKMYATSGVHIVFSTDSNALFLKLRFRRASTRTMGDAVDVLINGALYRSVGHAGKEESEIEQMLALPKGEKRVTLVLPSLHSTALGELSLSDGASFLPHTPQREMLIYGDSITQGYDAASPSRTYAMRLALALDAHAVCKAIGGEVFYPPLAKMDSGVPAPDVITVAYGVNDWHFGISSREEFSENARGFFEGLLKKYPTARVCAISPIWTRDFERGTPFSYRELPAMIASAAGERVTVIDGFSFVPEDERLYSDGLHPNDEGFDYYAEALLRALG